jgi:hypothetical protein
MDLSAFREARKSRERAKQVDTKSVRLPSMPVPLCEGRQLQMILLKKS